MPAGFGEGVDVFQAAGHSLTLGSSGSEMLDHFRQLGRVDAWRQVTVRVEFRPSLYGASLVADVLSRKCEVQTESHGQRESPRKSL